jgi:hypothetical protein
MSANEKLVFLLSATLMGMSLLTFLVVMRSVGELNHGLNRMEQILKKELILTYNRKVSELKQEKQRDDAALERMRRQDALLNIPLMLRKGKKNPPGKK